MEAEQVVRSLLVDTIVEPLMEYLCVGFPPEPCNNLLSHHPSAETSCKGRLLRSLLASHPSLGSLIVGHNDDAIQIKVLLQKWDRRGCGFYALHNLLRFLAALQASTDEEAGLVLHGLHSYASHWHLYWRCRNALSAHAVSRGNRHYPWTLRDVEHGLLERPYVEHLQLHVLPQSLFSANPKVCRDFTILPCMSVNALKNGIMEPHHVIELQQVFDMFRSCPSASHAFLVGSTSHWVCVVANKCVGEFEVFYMDSYNFPILDLTDAQIEEALAVRMQAAIDEGRPLEGFGTFEERLHRACHSAADAKFALRTISQGVRGHICFMTVVLDLVIEALLENFENVVRSEVSSLQTDELSQWLSAYYPPPVLQASVVNRIRDFGKQHISCSTVTRLLRWTNTWIDKCNEYSTLSTPSMMAGSGATGIQDLYSQADSNLVAAFSDVLVELHKVLTT
eukprot:GILK01008169.1.p1 GENE.GILK01008169.1~~GILK01008169.1.p1  ORF type:complete len:460 (-),score=31.46 GILK01008169.1:344-1696(-)